MPTSKQQLTNMFHAFCTFRQIATPSLFLTIFGETIGYHLWDKFNYYKSDVTVFYCYLDTENSSKFIEYLAKKTE